MLLLPIKYRILPSILFSALAFAHDGELNVNLEPYLKPQQGFSFLQEPGLRFAEMISLAGEQANNSTHLLIHNLSPVTQGSSYAASLYEAIELQSGTAQDAGIVYLTLPEGSLSSTGKATSNIVGIVPRQGSWQQYGINSPQNTTVGNSSGTAAYRYSPGEITFTLTQDQTIFTGTTSYQVTDPYTLQLEPFALASGSTSHPFKATTLVRDNMDFYGSLVSDDPGVAFDSLMFVIRLTGIPDTNENDIPDIVENALTLTPQQWLHHSIIGDYYTLNENWGYSPMLGFFEATSYPWIYQVHHGWMCVTQRSGDTIWLYSPHSSLGWLAGHTADNGIFLSSASTPQWSPINLVNP